MSFAHASRVRAIGGGRYQADIEPGWDIVGNAHGGYVMAIATRAASEAAGGLAPSSVTAHFLNPGRPGPVEVATKVVKQGRRFTTVQATMSSTDRPLLALLGSFTAQPTAPHPIERIEAAPPELPDPDSCIRVEPTETFPPPMMGRLDLRLHPDDATFDTGTPLFRGWLRLPDDEPIDPVGLLLAVDAFPPTAFAARLPIAWTPTLELTAHIRKQPERGWLRCQFSTRFISGGFLEEDGEVWDSTGALVAQSRQLALLPQTGT